MTQTRQRIMQEGEVLLKQHGYHGFSYADIARTVQITKASIHHHFATKATLVEEIVLEYRTRAMGVLGQPEAYALDEALHKLQQMYQGAFESEGQGCLCATLAADWSGLPDGVQRALYAYRKTMINWIAQVITNNMACSPARAEQMGMWILTLYEGAVTTARIHEQPHLLQQVAFTARATIDAQLAA